MSESRFLLDCEALLCSPNRNDTHGYRSVCVSCSFLGGLHSPHWASREPSPVFLTPQTLHLLLISLFPNPIVLGKETRATLKRLHLTGSKFNFYSIFEMICGKLELLWKGSGIVLPTAVLETHSSYQIKAREAKSVAPVCEIRLIKQIYRIECFKSAWDECLHHCFKLLTGLKWLFLCWRGI